MGDSKWTNYGDKSNIVEIINQQLPGEIVLVEDVISAHKVAQVTPSIPLFGTAIGDHVVKVLQAANRPVALWLDEDQYQLLPRKIGRLQTLLRQPVRYIYTGRDPKTYSIDEIKETLHEG